MQQRWFKSTGHMKTWWKFGKIMYPFHSGSSEFLNSQEVNSYVLNPYVFQEKTMKQNSSSHHWQESKQEQYHLPGVIAEIKKSQAWQPLCYVCLIHLCGYYEAQCIWCIAVKHKLNHMVTPPTAALSSTTFLLQQINTQVCYIYIFI